jgi:hypothetical protein
MNRCRIGVLFFTILFAAFNILNPLLPAFAGGERIVVMAIQGKGIAADEKNIYRSALVEALSGRYEVLSGDDVDNTVKEIFQKESRESMLCDTEKCLQEVAITMQAELIATCTVVKRSGGYLLNFQISNVLENKIVYATSEPCKACDEYRIGDMLKAMASGTPLPTVAKGGMLAVSSSPYEKGATVLIDGEVKGIVPAQIKLTSGEYVVTVRGKRAEGSQRIAIADGESTNLTVLLTRVVTGKVEKDGINIPWFWVGIGFIVISVGLFGNENTSSSIKLGY